MQKEILTSYELLSFISDIQIDIRHANPVPRLSLREYDKCTPNQAIGLGAERETYFYSDNKKYKLKTVLPSFLFDAINFGENISLLRYPHGMWTVLRIVYQVYDLLVKHRKMRGVPDQTILKNSLLVCQKLIPESNRLSNLFSGSFLLETICDLNTKVTSPSLWRCASFRGYPTLDDRVFINPGQNHQNDEICKGIVDVFTSFFSPHDITLNATMVKAWAISGALRDFPEMVKDYHLALVGPPWFSTLGRRWGVKNFKHIKIPSRGTHDIRDKVLVDIIAYIDTAVKQKSRPPIVLFHCGGSLAAWLIFRVSRLRPESILFDMGQAIVTWYMDEPFYAYPWLKIYGRAIIVNNNLESYYRNIIGAKFDKWYESYE